MYYIFALLPHSRYYEQPKDFIKNNALNVKIFYDNFPQAEIIESYLPSII